MTGRRETQVVTVRMIREQLRKHGRLVLTTSSGGSNVERMWVVEFEPIPEPTGPVAAA